MSSVLERLAAQRVVPVIRTGDPEDAVATARACAAAGMDVVELTCTTPRVAEALEALRGDGLCGGDGGSRGPGVGAGTRFHRQSVHLAMGGFPSSPPHSDVAVQRLDESLRRAPGG